MANRPYGRFVTKNKKVRLVVDAEAGSPLFSPIPSDNAEGFDGELLGVQGDADRDFYGILEKSGEAGEDSTVAYSDGDVVNVRIASWNAATIIRTGTRLVALVDGFGPEGTPGQFLAVAIGEYAIADYQVPFMIEAHIRNTNQIIGAGG